MMYEGEDVNTIDLLTESPTTEANGVKVIVPVKSSDRNDFFQKIKEQLAYFESVYFNVSVSYNTIANTFTIFRADDFQLSDMTTDKKMHICLDNVYYPIDFEKLGISQIDLPVGLRFSLSDGIFPTPNRESIRYTKEAKTIILSKIKKVADYFVNKYNEIGVETDDINVIFDYYSSHERYVLFNNIKRDITKILHYSDIKLIAPKLKGISLLDVKFINSIKTTLLNEYEVKYTMDSNRRLKEVKHSWDSEVRLSDISVGNCYLFNEKFGSNKKEYIKETRNGGFYKYYFIKRVKKMSLFKITNPGQPQLPYYVSYLNLKSHPKTEWRDRIKELQYVISLLMKDFINLDDIVVPQAWLDARKAKNVSLGKSVGRGPKLKGEIVCKQASQLERYVDGKNCKFVPTTYTLEKFSTNKFLTVYALHSNNETLDKLYNIAKKQKINFVTFSEREANIVSKGELHNLISIDDFMKGNTQPFKRLVTAHLIKLLMSEYAYTFNKVDRLKEVSTDLATKVEALLAYQSKHYTNSHNNDIIYGAILEVAKANNLFDMTIYSTYLEVKKVLGKLEFIETLLTYASSYSRAKDDKIIVALRDLCKYHKYRIDTEHYKLQLNEEVVIEDVLSEEIVEELIND